MLAASLRFIFVVVYCVSLLICSVTLVAAGDGTLRMRFYVNKSEGATTCLDPVISGDDLQSAVAQFLDSPVYRFAWLPVAPTKAPTKVPQQQLSVSRHGKNLATLCGFEYRCFDLGQGTAWFGSLYTCNQIEALLVSAPEQLLQALLKVEDFELFWDKYVNGKMEEIPVDPDMPIVAQTLASLPPSESYWSQPVLFDPNRFYVCVLGDQTVQSAYVDERTNRTEENWVANVTVALSIMLGAEPSIVDFHQEAVPDFAAESNFAPSPSPDAPRFIAFRILANRSNFSSSSESEPGSTAPPQQQQQQDQQSERVADVQSHGETTTSHHHHPHDETTTSHHHPHGETTRHHDPVTTRHDHATTRHSEPWPTKHHDHWPTRHREPTTPFPSGKKRPKYIPKAKASPNDAAATSVLLSRTDPMDLLFATGYSCYPYNQTADLYNNTNETSNFTATNSSSASMPVYRFSIFLRKNETRTREDVNAALQQWWKRAVEPYGLRITPIMIARRDEYTAREEGDGERVLYLVTVTPIEARALNATEKAQLEAMAQRGQPEQLIDTVGSCLFSWLEPPPPSTTFAQALGLALLFVFSVAMLIVVSSIVWWGSTEPEKRRNSTKNNKEVEKKKEV